MTDKSLADAIRERIKQLRGDSPYTYERRGRVMPWGDAQSVEAVLSF